MPEEAVEATLATEEAVDDAPGVEAVKRGTGGMRKLREDGFIPFAAQRARTIVSVLCPTSLIAAI
jgi:hypothetical protein